MNIEMDGERYYGSIVRNPYGRGGIAKLIVRQQYVELHLPFRRALTGDKTELQLALVRRKVSLLRRFDLRIDGMNGPWYFTTWNIERVVRALTARGWPVRRDG